MVSNSRVPKIISHFDGSNNIFADCIIFMNITICAIIHPEINTVKI